MNYNGFDIKEIGGVPYLFAEAVVEELCFFMSCNLETFVCNEQIITIQEVLYDGQEDPVLQ